MPAISLADSFLDSLAELDQADAKRVVLFLDKLVRAPEAASLRPEIVHDAADRNIRSFKITHDLRAIVHVSGDALLMLFAARHDRAYAWARVRCIECHHDGARYRLMEVGDPPGGGRPLELHVCATTGDLCRVLTARGIRHDLGA